jgi:cysteine desulfurase
MPMSEPTYLDYNATTPIAPEVLDVMQPALRDSWGNPSSPHAYGRRARAALGRAREQVAALVGCETDEVVFTSGGTESDNAAVVGVAEARTERGRHLVVSAVEHPAIEEACRYLETRGWEISRVPVRSSGRLETDDVAAALRDDTSLVSVMHAHNETGVVFPLAEIAAAARARGAVVHSDAAQSVGKIPVRVGDLGVDLLTVAGHKLYGPLGVGALILRRGTPFGGFLRGGGHEGGRRAGTENTPLIVGLGAACELARAEGTRRVEHLQGLRDGFERQLRESLPDVVVHGDGVERLPNTSFVAIPGADALQVLARLDDVAIGTGSACHSHDDAAPGVLAQMGVPDALARCTLRVTVGRPTSAEEVTGAADRIAAAARAVRG